MLNRNRGALLVSVAIFSLLALGAVATASSDRSAVESDEGAQDDDGSVKAITGPALGQASQAALDFLGEGKVTETEIDDEESYYEVEVTTPDGGQVDVQLDRDFKVVGHENESGGEDD